MVAVSLGTENDGSIICPSNFNSVVGIKPTVGLTSQAGTIPAPPRQDTIGYGMYNEVMGYSCITLAIKEEVEDLEKAGITVTLIDEATLKEGLRLRKSEHAFYLGWAVHSFRITNAGVQDMTQIHTHMCYSNFNIITHSIIDMDIDVITIENSRSDEKLLSIFREGVKYGAGIGPGVYDIHSSRIPSTEEFADRINKQFAVLETNILWVNPDCVLKTCKYIELKPALQNMVVAAKQLRTQLATDKAVSDIAYVLDAIVGFAYNDAEATGKASNYIPIGGYVQSNGAVVVDYLEIANISTILTSTLSGEATATLAEFKISLNAYLKELVASPVRSLAEVIAFNKKFADLDIFLAAEATNGIGDAKNKAIWNFVELARNGFVKLMVQNKLDVLVTVGSNASPVHAIGGFLAVSVPVAYMVKGCLLAYVLVD
ncbi:5-methyltetrahydropteroyltriglutamate--homocysteine methyltransferase-like [Olea europaea subsp. europaea]|uniref:5-methyltetrahydropteroyltriglutamate--homocysteine methyltransferase-like n=1 Tax=Olea europaea subsp. europaea TaxID=158383 RepID=A0A8S0PDH7_OLEEU|nr:5-methyltetrahydropteroyltriglutamate--homocysteine methyltransferase-like [Olea europaea subsp. europaea]